MRLPFKRRLTPQSGGGGKPSRLKLSMMIGVIFLTKPWRTSSSATASDNPPPSHQPSPPPSPSLTSPTPRSPLISSFPSDSESPYESRPKRGVPRTQKLVDNSQTAKEVGAAKEGKRKGSGPTRRKPGRKHWQRQRQRRCCSCWMATCLHLAVRYY